MEDGTRVNRGDILASGVAHEYLAESFSYFMTDPGNLKRKDPVVYGLLQERIFTSEEG